MTKEEREQRRLERKREQAEWDAKFPGVHYSPQNLQIILREGRPSYITIRTNELDYFKPSDIGGDSGWVEADIPLYDIERVAMLVAALTARLNYMIDEANAEIAKIPRVKELLKAPTADSGGDRPAAGAPESS